MQHWNNFINGEWVDSANSIEVENPATLEVVGTIASADDKQVDLAVSAARDCVTSGVLSRNPVQRRRWLHQISVEIKSLVEDYVDLATQENGKSLNDSRNELIEAADYFEYYAGMADKIEGKSIPLGSNYVDYTQYEPHGVSAQIIPWNFPVSLTARSAAPAIATGNAVVAKSPELCPLSSTLIAKACHRAGLPDGAFNLICGYGDQTGSQLIRHPQINHIVFTGSVATGQNIMRSAADQAIPCVMELGGKSAAVVFADADLERVIESVKWGIFFNAGQVCSAMSRLLVQRPVYQQLVDKIEHLIESFTIGNGRDNCAITPLASLRQKEAILAMCDRAKQSGVHCQRGGRAPAELNGHFVEPTLFTDVPPDCELFTHEVFGPVLAVTPFDTEEQAWELANATPFGLVAGVFTQDVSRALICANKLEAGQVFINEWYAGGIATPFGGFKMSGYGREKGLEALYSYVRTKNIAIKL